jgi:hypothetical protein
MERPLGSITGSEKAGTELDDILKVVTGDHDPQLLLCHYVYFSP